MFFSAAKIVRKKFLSKLCQNILKCFDKSCGTYAISLRRFFIILIFAITIDGLHTPKKLSKQWYFCGTCFDNRPSYYDNVLTIILGLRPYALICFDNRPELLWYYRTQQTIQLPYYFENFKSIESLRPGFFRLFWQWAF